MKRIAASTVVAVLALAALWSPTAGAREANAPAIKHCKSTYFAPLYTHIEKISAKGAGCSTRSRRRRAAWSAAPRARR